MTTASHPPDYRQDLRNREAKRHRAEKIANRKTAKAYANDPDFIIAAFVRPRPQLRIALGWDGGELTASIVTRENGYPLCKPAYGRTPTKAIKKVIANYRRKYARC